MKTLNTKKEFREAPPGHYKVEGKAAKEFAKQMIKTITNRLKGSKKKDLSSYIKAEICSIPCLLDVTYFKKVEPWKGSPHTCPSDVDYYGYLEIEYEVLDRKGYPAPWLASKVTPLINLDLEAIIREHYTKNGEPE